MDAAIVKILSQRAHLTKRALDKSRPASLKAKVLAALASNATVGRTAQHRKELLKMFTANDVDTLVEFARLVRLYPNEPVENLWAQAGGEAVQQGVQSDGACACGHKWESHNKNGCCWDEECECTQPRR